MGILVSSKSTAAEIQEAEAEGNQSPEPVKENQAPETEEETIGKDIDDLGRTQAGLGGSGPERSNLDLGSGVGEVMRNQTIEPKVSTEMSLGNPNENGLVESSSLELRRGKTVEKLESISSNEKRALSSGTEAVSGGNGVGAEENGSSLDKIMEEGSDAKSDSIESETCVDGGDEDDESDPMDETEEDSDWIPTEMDEDVGDEGHEFTVGDFVWGKIKSHPWWPAQVYDPTAASEYAEKLKPTDKRLLVAYFGDGTFAWCHSSQLKRFEEHFQEMSKQSSSKAFVTAVQQAVDEIGRLVMLNMSCSCVRKDFLDGFSQPLALNAGIKEGVLVPEGKVGKLWDRLSEPAEILADLKRVGQVVSVTSVLDLAGLESWLSAFYYSKGGYQMPAFVKPQPIPGLEDDQKAVEVPKVVLGPSEDWLSSPKRNKTGQTDLTSSQSSPDTFDKRQYHRRKQKSIADLMEGEDEIKVRAKDVVVKEEAKSEKPGSSSGRKTKRGSERRDKSGLASESENKRIKLSKSPISTRSKKVSSFENGCSDRKEEEPKKGQLSRRRKKEKELDSNDVEAKEEDGDSPISRDGGLQSGMKDHIETRTLSRERKRSKYLSPPFTTLNLGRITQQMEVEETKSGAASADIIGSPPPMVNTCTKTAGGSNPETQAEDEKKKRFDPVKAGNASTRLVLSEVRSAAVNPSVPIKEKSCGTVMDFVSTFRDSVFSNGANYELYKNRQPHRKRRVVLISEPGSEAVETLPDSDSGKKKVKLSQETKSDRPPPPKQAVEVPSSEPRRRRSKLAAAGKTDDKPSPPSLFVTFGPGSSLPTKADLIRIYNPFGELDEAETEMFYNNFCARICFLRSSDAEAAFKHSQNDSPFGASNVNFRLHNLSAATKVRELSEISESPPAKSRSNTKTQPSASQPQPPVGGESSSQVDLIKQKLQKMTSMLGSSDGSVSAVMKSNMESEIRDLLETVSAMAVAGSSSS